MPVWSIERRIRAIQKYQKADLVELARSEPEAAAKNSLQPYFGAVGTWFPQAGSGQLLELGCGPGRYAALFASMGYNVTAVDPFEFPTWEDILRYRHVEFASGVKAERLPYPDQHFDYVACLNALLYFENPVKALSEIRRVLKAGGKLIVRTVNRTNLVKEITGKNLDPAAPNYFTESELERFLTDQGFVVQKTFSYGFFLPFAPNFWWYLVNGKIPIFLQEWFSEMTPARYRVNAIAFANLPAGA